MYITMAFAIITDVLMTDETLDPPCLDCGAEEDDGVCPLCDVEDVRALSTWPRLGYGDLWLDRLPVEVLINHVARQLRTADRSRLWAAVRFAPLR
jgi:hypothetical protein